MPIQCHHLNKLSSTRVTNAAYQVSKSSSFWLQRGRFYHIWVWWPSWSCDIKHLFPHTFSYTMEDSHEFWLQSAIYEEPRNILLFILYKLQLGPTFPTFLLPFGPSQSHFRPYFLTKCSTVLPFGQRLPEEKDYFLARFIRSVFMKKKKEKKETIQSSYPSKF